MLDSCLTAPFYQRVELDFFIGPNAALPIISGVEISRRITVSMSKKILAKQTPLHVFGLIQYTDVAGEGNRTRFLYAFAPGRDAKGDRLHPGKRQHYVE